MRVHERVTFTLGEYLLGLPRRVALRERGMSFVTVMTVSHDVSPSS
jgi:hypothetical protein